MPLARHRIRGLGNQQAGQTAKRCTQVVVAKQSPSKVGKRLVVAAKMLVPAAEFVDRIYPSIRTPTAIAHWPSHKVPRMKSSFRATALLSSSSIVSILVSLASAKVMALCIQPEGYGYYGLLQSFVAVASLLAGMGMATGLVRIGAGAVTRNEVSDGCKPPKGILADLRCGWKPGYGCSLCLSSPHEPTGAGSARPWRYDHAHGA